MSCRHCASQLASFGSLLVFGPWAAQPSVESAGGTEDLPRWTAEGCALAATSTTWPLYGTSSDWYWCRFEKQSHHTTISHPMSTSLPLVLSVRSTRKQKTGVSATNAKTQSPCSFSCSTATPPQHSFGLPEQGTDSLIGESISTRRRDLIDDGGYSLTIEFLMASLIVKTKRKLKTWTCACTT